MTSVVNSVGTPGAAMLGAAVAVFAPTGVLITASPEATEVWVVQGINAPSETRSPTFFSNVTPVGLPVVEEGVSFFDDVHVIEPEDAWAVGVEDAGPLERPAAY